MRCLLLQTVVEVAAQYQLRRMARCCVDVVAAVAEDTVLLLLMLGVAALDHWTTEPSQRHRRQVDMWWAGLSIKQ